MSKEQPIIIVKKKKKGHGGHHGGAWKVAYADFVTAMMALFIVLWILGQSEKAQKAVSFYFNHPDLYMANPKAFEEAFIKSLDEAYGTTGTVSEQTPSPPTEKPEASPTVDPKEASKQLMETVAKEIKIKISSMPEFNNIKDKVTIEVYPDSAVIDLMEPEGTYFFELGDSSMKPQARKLLTIITKELNRLNNKIIIAGHTDSRPFISGGRTYSNWELSADRANNARRIMEEAGFNPEKIVEIRGNADKDLKYPDKPDSPANRRITIRVLFEDKKDNSATKSKESINHTGEPTDKKSHH
ncbi:MAG: flagellar motor protein MotB [Candidatus Eremiobacterota bacterium]